ncbi:hypothetical protein [Falsibacillus pallidus]|uniref:Uncharacterized protein n=1 Tax=Falsibacillus pallidus TaxID=493781 RepID=A0A370G0Y3_9BACI|nr:hypothetical protein [Falsibacillus pallidus]RDI37541.1 hypothetical protein DFR59_12138 [Falsibacillus pallidus]
MAFKKLLYKKALVVDVNGNLEHVSSLTKEFSIDIYSVFGIEDEEYKEVRRNFELTLNLRERLSENNVDVIVVNSISEFDNFEQLYSFVHFFSFIKFNIVFAKERVDTGKKQSLFEVLRYVHASNLKVG